MAESRRPPASDLFQSHLASWILLASFVLEVFLLSPLVGMGVVPVWLGAAGTSVTLVVAALALRGRRGVRGILVAVVLLAVASHWGNVAAGARKTELLQAFTTALACGTFAVLFLVDVFSVGRLPNRLLAVLFAYLFMGAAWAGLYHLAEILRPGSLTLPGVTHPGSEFMYFSFTTLTTIGFGDILPVGPLVRSLAILEALTGQLYLVLVVSRFVGERAAPAAGRHPPAT